MTKPFDCIATHILNELATIFKKFKDDNMTDTIDNLVISIGMNFNISSELKKFVLNAIENYYNTKIDPDNFIISRN